MKRYLAVICILFLLAAPAFANCTAIIVGKKASATGNVIFSHNEDDGGRQVQRHGWVPAKEWPDGYFLPPDRTLARGSAKVPQVKNTLGFFWAQAAGADGDPGSACGFLNEAGVAVASNANGTTRTGGADLTDNGVWWNLRRVIAERATSSKVGAQVGVDLLSTWGYNQNGRNYNIVDRNEGWMLQAIRGKTHVAARVPDDHVAVMPNCTTIRHLALFDQIYSDESKYPGFTKTDYIKYPSGLVAFAQAQGFYNPAVQTEGLDYALTFYTALKGASDAYRQKYAYDYLLGNYPWKSDGPLLTVPGRTSPVNPASANPAAPSTGAITATHVEKMGEYEYPFSMQFAEGSITVARIRQIASTHYEGSPHSYLNSTTMVGPGRSPHNAVVSNARLICVATTQENKIFQFTADPKFTTVWMAPGRPCTLPHIPMHPIAGYGVLPEVDDFGPYGTFEVENHFAPSYEKRLYQKDLGWQKFRDFQDKLDMVYKDAKDAFYPIRDKYFTDMYEANMALINAGDVSAIKAFDEKAMADALALIDNFQNNTYPLMNVPNEASGLNIGDHTGNTNVTVIFTLPEGEVPTGSVYLLAGQTSPGGTTSSAVFLGNNRWSATFSMSRTGNNLTVPGLWEYCLGGSLVSGKTFASTVVIDCQSSTHTKPVYRVAPEDQTRVIGRVPIDNSWRGINTTRTVLHNYDFKHASYAVDPINGSLYMGPWSLVGWKSDIPGDDKIYVGGDTITLGKLGTVNLTAVFDNPSITVAGQPAEETTVTEGETESLTVDAGVSAGSTLSYQWYINTTNSNTGGTPVEGATGASFTIPDNLPEGEYYFYCVIGATDAKGTLYKTSDVAKVIVEAKGKDGSGGGNCNAGYSAIAIALILVPFIIRKRK